VKKSNLRIEHRCPQCAAPVFLEETDHALSCEYCRTRLVFRFPGDPTYYLAPKTKNLRNVAFIPYWRFRGLAYSCEPTGVNHRIVDATRRAAGFSAAPVSLGYRTQTLNLKPLNPQARSKFLTPEMDSEELIDQVKSRSLSSIEDGVMEAMSAETRQSFVNIMTSVSANARGEKKRSLDNALNSLAHSAGKPQPLTSFLGEVTSLIYSPVVFDDKNLYDAVTKSVLAETSEEMLTQLNSAPPSAGAPVTFLPAICPHCGGDLDGGKDSEILTCGNCDSAWYLGLQGLQRVNCALMAPTNGANTLHLPFWKISPDIEGMELNSYADLARLANLPRMSQPSWKDRELSFWAPAFRLPPSLYIKIARRATIRSDEGRPGYAIRKANLSPASLSVNAVSSWLKALLFDLARAKGRVFEQLREIRLTPRSHELVYLPFEARGGELLDTSVKMRISRNALKRW